MIERPRWITRNAVIALVLLSFSQVHAEESAIASNGHESNNVVEEIVVIGRNKRPRLHSDRSLIAGPSVRKPSRFDWQLLPTYDPEQVNLNLGLLAHDERAARAGIVTLFRLSFGR